MFLKNVSSLIKNNWKNIIKILIFLFILVNLSDLIVWGVLRPLYWQFVSEKQEMAPDVVLCDFRYDITLKHFDYTNHIIDGSICFKREMIKEPLEFFKKLNKDGNRFICGDIIVNKLDMLTESLNFDNRSNIFFNYFPESKWDIEPRKTINEFTCEVLSVIMHFSEMDKEIPKEKNLTPPVCKEVKIKAIGNPIFYPFDKYFII